jgi:predicted transcriptional regulator
MSEEKVTLTFRTDAQTRDALDSIARTMHRDRSYIVKEAVASYIVRHQSYKDLIEERLKEADAGKFATDEEVEAFFDQWADDAKS